MFTSIRWLLVTLSVIATNVVTAQENNLEQLGQQVAHAERAFAATMANRDYEAFKAFVSDDAIFYSGEIPMRGKQKIADSWKPFFDGPDAPFSWEPRSVEVLDSGTLALSTGPVSNPDGKVVAIFTSIWRLEAPGQWRIIFDKGSDICENQITAAAGGTE